MMDSDNAGVKSLHILSLLMDPKTTMPKPIYSVMKNISPTTWMADFPLTWNLR